MKRRTVLTLIGTGAATWVAGCLSVEEAGPIDFELRNFTHDTHQVEVTIADGGRNTVLEETYEIEERQDGARVVREEGFTDATNREPFDIVVAPSDGEPEEWEFRMSCNRSDRTEGVFLAEIHETPDGDHTYFEFQQPTCSGGL